MFLFSWALNLHGLCFAADIIIHSIITSTLLIHTDNNMSQKTQFVPIPCPRCNQGMYCSSRALSMHLNRCDFDLFQCTTSDLSNKRSRVLSTTNAQRAHQILQNMNMSHVSGSRRNENRLAISTPVGFVVPTTTSVHRNSDSPIFKNSTDDFIHESHDDTNTQVAHDNINVFDNNVTDHAVRSLIVPPGLQFGIQLQHIISSHRGVDLKLFDEITDLVKSFSNTDFSSVKLYHRKELTSTITSLYNLHHLKHSVCNVQLSDQSIVSVPVFNVKSIILSMLQDPYRMKKENFAIGYDIFSGKSTQQITHLDEIHTGALWPVARNHCCNEETDEFPLALLCFYDKTHTDLHGALSCAPFLMTFSFFNESACSCDEFYEVLAYVPNLSYGYGKSNPKQSRDKLADEHKCLKLVTDQIKQLADGVTAVVMGKKVTIKPWIHFISGDPSGHNNLCGQYNSSSATFPYRDCKCSQAQLCDSVPNCSLITLAEYASHKQQDTLQMLSLHSIENSFIDLPFGDIEHGIFGCVPAEMLHVSGNGIMQYMLDSVNQIIASGLDKKFTLHQLDTLHQNLVRDSLSQSE
jgi:hypothetical protein